MTGPNEVRKAVREQISNGADCIKVFADHALEGIPSFTLEEFRAAVDESHIQGRKISAHTIGPRGAHIAVQAGVDSIEHGIQN